MVYSSLPIAVHAHAAYTGWLQVEPYAVVNLAVCLRDTPTGISHAVGATDVVQC